VVLVRNALAALLGFLLTAAVVYWLLPHRPNLVDERLEKGLAQKDHCEVLFVGPSYIWSDFEPDAFDEEARRIGLDARSCKFGVSALMGYDLKLNLERLFAEDWPRLELVVIDITLGPGVAFPRENWFKPRVLHWHTWGSLPWLWDYYEKDPRSWLEKAPLVSAHAQHVAAHYVRLGGGRDLLEDARPLERLLRRERRKATDAGRDDEIIRARGPTGTKAHERRLERLKKKKAERRKRRKKPKGDWPLELREFVRGHGFEAYFVFAPVFYTKTLPGTPRGHDALVVFDFNDPERYPDVYREDARGYSHHLNEKGGVVYSKLLARELEAVGFAR
jgi:hypothetical protein